MNKEGMMLVRAKQATMWTLNGDRKTVRLAVPPLRLAGVPGPDNVYMDFDAITVDAMLERLTVLRSQMLPREGLARVKLGADRGDACFVFPDGQFGSWRGLLGSCAAWAS